jgi:hypothetical protein
LINQGRSARAPAFHYSSHYCSADGAAHDPDTPLHRRCAHVFFPSGNTDAIAPESQCNHPDRMLNVLH